MSRTFGSTRCSSGISRPEASFFVDIPRRGDDDPHVGLGAAAGVALVVERAEALGQRALRLSRKVLNAFQVQGAAVGQAPLVEDVQVAARPAGPGREHRVPARGN